MLELLGVFLFEILAVFIGEWIFGGVFKALSWVGYRGLSIFTGEWEIPVRTLREKHDASIWPWVIVFGLIGGVAILLVTF